MEELKVNLTKMLLINILSILVVIFARSIFFAGHYANDDNASYEKIILYVNDNYELLKKFPYSEIKKIKSLNESIEIKKQREEETIKRHLGENTIVKSVYAYNENILQFYCGDSGFLDVGTYTGFYFSKEDTPCAFEFSNLALVEISPGVFEGQDENGAQQIHGGHKIHTEKIRDNWYYHIQYWY